MRIQHNIMSMNAYRNYNNNTSALSKNLEKLSSGYKINRAGDDAAGLAISEKMRAQITGLTQAQANAKSGINLVQTAEGALQEVHDMLNRMVKLADQSANGTYDNETDRANLQKEVVQLKSEIDRIADSANFNGIKLLNGNLQNGATVGGGEMDINSILTGVSAKQSAVAAVKTKFSVSLDGLSVKTGSQATSATLAFSIGGQNLSVKFTGLTANTDNDLSQVDPNTVPTSLTINGSKFKVSHAAGKLTFEMEADPTTTTNAQALAGAYDVTVSGTGVGGSINKGTQVITTGKVEQKATQAIATMNLSADMMKNGTAFKIGATVYTLDFNTKSSAVAAGNTSIGVKDLLDNNGKITDVNKVASLLTLAASTNADFSVGNNGSSITLQSKTGNTDDLDTIDLVKAEFSVTLPSEQGSSLVLQIGDTSDAFNQLSVSIDDTHVKSLGIDGVDIGKQASAKEAVDKIKAAINTVSSIRGTLGATQNRLDHTINNLSVMTENIQDAESTVRDTDVAEEMMAYTKNNILVQSAQAMLAQANQVPQGVLQLLQ